SATSVRPSYFPGPLLVVTHKTTAAMPFVHSLGCPGGANCILSHSITRQACRPCFIEGTGTRTGPDYDDPMAATEAVVAKGFVDVSRMYVSGCSGGGVLSSWVIGHTNRSAAAAVRCPVIDLAQLCRAHRHSALYLQLL